MTSETPSLSTIIDNQDSTPIILQVRSKLRGQILYKQELSFSKKSFNIQCAKKKQAQILKFSPEENLSSHIFRGLNIRRSKKQGAVLKSSKAIKELDIQYIKVACTQHRMLNYPLENIKRLSSLQNLKLNLSWTGENEHFKTTNPSHNCSLIHNIALRKIYHALEGLTSLQTLSFHFPNCEITGEGIVYIDRILKRLRNLKKIALDFSKCSLFTGAGIQKICKQLKRISSLEAVSLDFSRCIQIVESDLHLILQSLQGIHSLHTVNLKLSECPQISNLQFQNIHSYLSQLTSLKRFSLDFSECQINDREVENLCLGLKELNSLPFLSLDLSECRNFTENGLYSLSKSLQTMTNLTHLSLSFNSWHLYDTGLNIFAGSLKELTGLKGLSLDFFGCGYLTSVGLSNLSETLKGLLCLQNINLNFASCYQINDKDLDCIASALEKMSHLQNLNFNFSKCAISDIGVQKINQTLKKLDSLKYVKLER